MLDMLVQISLGVGEEILCTLGSERKAGSFSAGREWKDSEEELSSSSI